MKLTVEIVVDSHEEMMKELWWVGWAVARNASFKILGGSSAGAKWDMSLSSRWAPERGESTNG